MLTFKNINYSVRVGKSSGNPSGIKKILVDVSGEVNAGEIVAIIGSSGSGKTTLINILAGRISSGILTGEILFDGERRNPGKFKKQVAYVEQRDILHPTLTVQETLKYAAEFRLDKKLYSPTEKRERIRVLLNNLRLSKAADTLVGDNKIRGVSGGERKRTSIGVELITDPKILIMDEPTTGLDSNSAEMVIKLARSITKRQKLATITVIHQPSSKVFRLFDKIIILAPGGIVYNGPVSKSMEYFSSIGYTCPEHENAPNFFINLITIDTNTEKGLQTSTDRVEELKRKWLEHQAKLEKKNEPIRPLSEQKQREDTSGGGLFRKISMERARTAIQHRISTVTEGFFASYKTTWVNSWHRELGFLLRRSWRRELRDKRFIYSTFASVVVTTVLIGFTYFNNVSGFVNIQNKNGLIFLLTLNEVFAVVMPILPMLIEEKTVMNRERASGTYRVSTFGLALTLTKLPILLVMHTIFLTSVYFLAKFRVDGLLYVIFLLTFLLTVICSFGFALAISSITSSVEVATVIAPLILCLFVMFGGYLVNLQLLTPALSWLRYISYVYYAYSNVVTSQFKGVQTNCGPFESCPDKGQELLDAYGLGGVSYAVNFSMLALAALVFYLVAYLALRFKMKPRYIWI